MTTTPDTETTADLLRALGHATRLELVRALREGERSVGDIEAATGVSQPGLSQQLAVLRKADLVTTRREAKQVFYRLNTERFAALAKLCGELAAPGGEPPSPPGDLPGGSSAAVFARVG
ncbi:ArsR/SmtB family transcription factor [Stakelama tenebrarum]|uniref:Helix-turn-helix transcriptional regulator n=1 Tax=Stakelama tenebrarum TaxID=2711215 RepID=A0A6G6Y3W0_9SPHN|nr:metalloregulator ArsR/SmtB family transcription factor [Sphingosinithalassobacter tenebrarum]QIG79408.1 helix-turn-helix transcriptional regulator [Sphingosinithalassobacter tenebrarum]